MTAYNTLGYKLFRATKENERKTKSKEEKEMEREKRWRKKIDRDFSPPGTRNIDWTYSKPDGITVYTTYKPGTLKEWASYRIRKNERLALEIKKERAWDSLPGGWLEEDQIQNSLKNEGFTEPWNQLDMHYFENADEFTNRLIGEARKLVNEGQTSEDESLAEAVKKMTTF